MLWEMKEQHAAHTAACVIPGVLKFVKTSRGDKECRDMYVNLEGIQREGQAMAR